LSALIRKRRSVRDFRPDPIPAAVLADATWAPTWSNSQPYRVAIASGAARERIAAQLCDNFDRGMAAQNGGTLAKLKLLLTRRGLPDGDFNTQLKHPDDLQPRHRDTGRGLYALLGINRKGNVARDRQMRRNFEFFGAPTALFLFAHRGLREVSVLAACRTFIASAPEALLAHSGDEYSGSFIAFYSYFCSAVRQKRFRPFGLRVATASAALRPLPMEEPLAASRALQPSFQPHNASHAESPTGC